MIHHESFIFTLSPFCLFKFKEFYTNKQTRVHWPSHVWLVTDVFLMNVICFQHHVDNSEQDFSNVVSALMICVSVCVCVCVGVPPPGPSVMVMQLSVPNGPQPTQNPPMVQWNPCKYYSVEQRPSKPEPQVLRMHTQTHTRALIMNFSLQKP